MAMGFEYTLLRAAHDMNRVDSMNVDMFKTSRKRSQSWFEGGSKKGQLGATALASAFKTLTYSLGGGISPNFTRITGRSSLALRRKSLCGHLYLWTRRLMAGKHWTIDFLSFTRRLFTFCEDDSSVKSRSARSESADAASWKNRRALSSSASVCLRFVAITKVKLDESRLSNATATVSPRVCPTRDSATSCSMSVSSSWTARRPRRLPRSSRRPSPCL